MIALGALIATGRLSDRHLVADRHMMVDRPKVVVRFGFAYHHMVMGSPHVLATTVKAINCHVRKPERSQQCAVWASRVATTAKPWICPVRKPERSTQCAVRGLPCAPRGSAC